MAAIDSVSLLAQTAYTKIQERPVDVRTTNVVTEASKFQDMVGAQFNKFANMSPTQILNHIQNAKSASVTRTNVDNGGVVYTAAKNIRETIGKQEAVVRKSLIGEASLIDVLTSTTEAQNTLETLVKARDKFFEKFDQVMNMSM